MLSTNRSSDLSPLALMDTNDAQSVRRRSLTPSASSKSRNNVVSWAKQNLVPMSRSRSASASPQQSPSLTPADLAQPLRTSTSYMTHLEKLPEAVQSIFDHSQESFMKVSFPNVSRAHELAALLPKSLPQAAEQHLVQATCRKIERNMTGLLLNLESSVSLVMGQNLYKSMLEQACDHHGKATEFPSAQRFVFALIQTSWVVRYSLEEAVDDYVDDRVAKQCLRTIINRLEAVTNRLVMPILTLIKQFLVDHLSSHSVNPDPSSLAGVMRHIDSHPGTSKYKAPLSVWPPYLLEFSELLSRAKYLLKAVARPCGFQGFVWITSVAVQIIWKGLLLYSCRKCQTLIAVSDDSHGRPSAENCSGTSTPLPTVKQLSAAHITSALRSIKVSRSKSKINNAMDLNADITSIRRVLAWELSTFAEMITAFVDDLLEPSICSVLNKSDDEEEGSDSDSSDDDEELAALSMTALRAALKSLHAMCDVASALNQPRHILNTLTANAAATPIYRSINTLPRLLLINLFQSQSDLPALSTIYNVDHQELCNMLPGFSASEEWAPKTAKIVGDYLKTKDSMHCTQNDFESILKIIIASY